MAQPPSTPRRTWTWPRCAPDHTEPEAVFRPSGAPRLCGAAVRRLSPLGLGHSSGLCCSSSLLPSLTTCAPSTGAAVRRALAQSHEPRGGMVGHEPGLPGLRRHAARRNRARPSPIPSSCSCFIRAAIEWCHRRRVGLYGAAVRRAPPLVTEPFLNSL